jgi:hypothetical protein
MRFHTLDKFIPLTRIIHGYLMCYKTIFGELKLFDQFF